MLKRVYKDTLISLKMLSFTDELTNQPNCNTLIKCIQIAVSVSFTQARVALVPVIFKLNKNCLFTEICFNLKSGLPVWGMSVQLLSLYKSMDM